MSRMSQERVFVRLLCAELARYGSMIHVKFSRRLFGFVKNIQRFQLIILP